MPTMVLAGSPGIRWIMKNTMIVTPIATGISISRRWKTNVIRPNGCHLHGWSAAYACGPYAADTRLTQSLLTEPDILHVHVAERRHEEAVHIARGGVRVGRVVQVGHERV